MAILEVCVDTFEGARAAIAGGAARIELCASLSEGGLTPSAGLMRAAGDLNVPCYAMIRPRSGLFKFSEAEIEIMLSDIQTARQARLAGVVLGVQDKSGGLDKDVLARLVDAAGDLGTTLHRVVDVVPDPLEALDIAIELGFERVLTSGAQPFAPDGVGLIKQMAERASQRIKVMPGCGITAENVAGVIAATGATEIHAACIRPAAGYPAFSDFDPPGGRFVTSQEDVAAMVEAMQLPQ